MTNTAAPASITDLLTSPSARCTVCDRPFSRRRDIARHVAAKHPVQMTPVSELKLGDLVEWTGVRREVTRIKPLVHQTRVTMGATFTVTMPSTTTRVRKVCR